jgi:transcriptional regulator with XRE-family HTH domain
MRLLHVVDSDKVTALPLSQTSSATLRIKEELARKRMSRATLADLAKISLSSLEKGLSGRRNFTDQTLIRIEGVLGLRLRNTRLGPGVIAPDTLGSYSRAAVKWLEGTYVTLRPSTSNAEAIYSYRIDIAWDDDEGQLVFQEASRTDIAYSQAGDVAVSHQSGHIYLITNRHGQHRLITLSRQGVTGELYGLLLTLQTDTGARLVPVAMPIVLVPLSQVGMPPRYGTITASDSCHAMFKNFLDRTLEGGFAKMMR